MIVMSEAPTLGSQGVQATVDLFAHFPDAPIAVNRREQSVELVPSLPDTFPVTVYDQGEDAMIAAGRWHTHYEEPDQVAWCALWLMTPYYRLVEELKGGVLVATWIERYEETGWEGFEPVYFLNPEHPESWELLGDERYVRRYTQQGLLPSPQPYGELCPGAHLDEEGLPPDFHPGKRVIESTESQGIALF